MREEITKELTEKVGEAFYILDSEQFRCNFAELKKAFSDIYPHFNIAYSYKTNYTPKLCRLVNELGGYAEVVSEMELELATRIGVKPNRIIWNGPVKNPQVLESFLLSGGTANMDSLDELEFVQALAGENGEKTLNVGIRCNYDVNDGVISRFGFDVDSEDFKNAIQITKETKNINLINLQCHFAKRQIEYWPMRAAKMIDLIDRIGIVPQRIDIGGGLFGKMASSLKAQFTSRIPDYSEYAKAAATVFAKRFPDSVPELIIEPGSALVGDCMRFVGTVKSIKCVRGRNIATILGSQKNISMTGVNPPMEIIQVGTNRKEYDAIDIVGYTCIEGDLIFKDYQGSLAVGDLVVISNCGSYSIVMKPPFILPQFPIIDMSDGKIEVIKQKETFDDLFHTFVF